MVNLKQGFVSVLLCGLLAACAFASDSDRDLDLLVMPGFGNYNATFAIWSFAIRNPGPATSGTLSVKLGPFQSSLEVEIPHQTAINRDHPVLVYLPDSESVRWAEKRFTLRAKDGRSAKYLIPEQPNMGNVGSPGDAKLLIRDDGSADLSGIFASLNVREAPELASAYLPYQSIYLTGGTRTLSDGAVSALLDYVASGGNLVFLPNAKLSALDDSRWAAYLPAKAGPLTGTKEVLFQVTDPLPASSNSRGNSATAKPIRASLTFHQLKPRSTAEMWHFGDVPCAAQSRFGLGTFVVAAFESLNDGRTLIALDAILPSRRPHFATDVRGYSGDFGGPVLRVPMLTSTSEWLASGNSAANTDPFQAKPPSLLKVVLTLIGYAVAVLLAALLGQKVYKKGEIAWITTPILSLGFAGFFFSFAGNLYRAQESRSVAALLVGDATTGRGYAWGTSQIFVPKGGRRDFKTQGVQYLVPERKMGQTLDSNALDEAAFSNLNLRQTRSEFNAPEVELDKLAFVTYRFQQKVDITSWFSVDIDLKKGKNGLVANGSFRNGSPYALSEAAITVGSDQFLLYDVPPHSTSKISNALCTRFGAPTPIAQIPDVTFKRSIGLEATMHGFDPGPQIGQVQPQHENVKLAVNLGNMAVRP